MITWVHFLHFQKLAIKNCKHPNVTIGDIPIIIYTVEPLNEGHAGDNINSLVLSSLHVHATNNDTSTSVSNVD